MKKGFEFKLVVVGKLGLVKSMFINLILLTDLCPERVLPGAAEKIAKTLQIEALTVKLKSEG